MAQVPEISPAAFRERWQLGTADVILLDVREPEELALASIAEAMHIPMNQVPQRLDKLDRARPVVVMCHSGRRSRQVAEYLIANGFDNVFNLEGGIDAWSRQVQPSLPRY
jgi:rhodanese-related sulfurtransferase